MGRRLGIAVLCGLMAAPAAAADWDSVAGWDVREIGDTSCVVGRVFADAGLTFGLIMSVDGKSRVFATSAGWPTRAGQPIAALVAFDGKPMTVGPSVGIEERQNRGFVAAADDALLAGFAGATRLTVRAGPSGPTGSAALTGSADGLAQGRRCLSALRGDRRAPPAPPVLASRTLPVRPSASVSAPAFVSVTPTIATRAVPKASLASWVGDTEYPAAALRARQEGATTVRIAIDPAGSVATCDVARTSGSPALDEETCRIFKRRGRYRPARDGAGTAIASIEQQTIRWKLPD